MRWFELTFPSLSDIDAWHRWHATGLDGHLERIDNNSLCCFLRLQDPVSICMVLRRLLKATQTYLERGARHPLRSNALV